VVRRLYLQLYLAFLAVALACLVAAAIAVRVVRDPPPGGGRPFRRAVAAMLERSLPPANADRSTLEAELRALAADLELDLVVWDARGAVIAASTDTPPARIPPPHQPQLPLAGRPRGRTQVVVRLPDGRRVGLYARGSDDSSSGGGGGEAVIAWLAVVAVTMALGLYPVARRITRRVERLDRAVRRWGQGELAQRVDVDGRDEIATMAESYNRAAQQIETLVGQQRQILANASHELRSPLARLRMAIELAGEAGDPGERRRRLDGAAAEIADLDALVDHVLVMARADLRAPHAPFRPVALLPIAAEEAARTGARLVEGAVDAAAGGAVVAGDPALLRHMLRNLLENARQHGRSGEGPGADVEIQIAAGRERVVVTVDDRGPGIPESERDQIFEPFFRGGRTRAEGRGGTGLGLALVRQVARFHGGEVACHARPGGGSRFEVTLPVVMGGPPGAVRV
jgi:signal transduction histidine kinase